MEKFAFYKSAAGMIRQANSAEAYIYERGTDGIFRGVSISVDESGIAERVTLTGWACIRTGKNTMYQTTTGEYIDLNDGWAVVGSATLYSQSQAQSLVNKIIRNNQTIIANNLFCARYSEKLTKQQRQQVVVLQQRLEERNNALIEDGVCGNLEQSYPAGYAELQPYLQSLMDRQGVGSVTVTIIVAALVIASLSTAAYFAYRSFAAESEQDVKFSKELTKTLMSKLTPEEYEQLRQETKGIVTKARLRQSLSNYSKILTMAAAGIGAYFLYKTFMNHE